MKELRDWPVPDEVYGIARALRSQSRLIEQRLEKLERQARLARTFVGFSPDAELPPEASPIEVDITASLLDPHEEPPWAEEPR